MKNADLYEYDFFDWSQTTAELLRSGRWTEVDRESVAEEIESLGRRDKRELVSRLKVLIVHLLKWQTQAAERSASWQKTIRGQRSEIAVLLKDSPSLRRRVPEMVEIAYPDAALDAVDEMRLLGNPFPDRCPFTGEQILGNWWPGTD